MNCAIIGAGQLGRRHLQGLLTCYNAKLNIFILDPSSESLAVAELRAKEIEHSHELFFTNTIHDLPKDLEFVVIATNSKVRLNAMETLFQHARVRNLILEKILFPVLEQYTQALELVHHHQVSCWVNHTRRMYEAYHQLKSYFNHNKTYSFQLVGASWGLACNGLHFIDLFEFLTDSKLTSISNSLLDGQPIESKRSGYVEFDGTLTGTLDHKHHFSITSCRSQTPIAPTLCIMTDDVRIVIQESGTPKVYLFKKENRFNLEEETFQVLYQSQLTGILFEQIQTSGTCALPPFDHASSTHQIFLASILNRWNEVTKSSNILLPIT